jgi:hypothetical protein
VHGSVDAACVALHAHLSGGKAPAVSFGAPPGHSVMHGAFGSESHVIGDGGGAGAPRWACTEQHARASSKVLVATML